MSIITKIIIRIIYLIIFLVVSNYVYKVYFFEKDIQQYSDIINLVRKVPDNADIVYLGESSNTTVRGDDKDKRAISTIIADNFPKLKIYDITKPASHADVYKVLISHIPKTNKLKTLIVTLNLRSFNAQWIYSDLETAIQKSLVLLRPYPPLINRFMLSFKAYDIKTKKERERQFKHKWKHDKYNLPFKFDFDNLKDWEGYVWHKGVLNPDGTKNFELKNLTCHYIKAYAFQIDTLKSPRIKDFDQIVEIAKKRNWKLVFNLMAENTQRAKELLGNDILYFLEYNRKLLIDYYQRKGVTVVDNLNSVENEQFIDQDWTTEHYAEKGRQTIATNVTDTLMKILNPKK